MSRGWKVTQVKAIQEFGTSTSAPGSSDLSQAWFYRAGSDELAIPGGLSQGGWQRKEHLLGSLPGD